MLSARRITVRTCLRAVLWTSAFVSATPARQQADTAEEHADRGAVLAQAGDLTNAEAEFRRAISLSPENPQFLASLGGILGMEHKLEASIVYFEKALQIDPNNLKTRRDLAATQWQIGQLRQAQQNLERILKSEPSDKSSILLLGMVAENLKDYARAARLLSSVPDMTSQRMDSIVALGRSYYRTGQQQKARDALNTLLTRPTTPEGLFLGGQVASEEGDAETALKLFNSIESTYPDPAKLAYSRAQAQYRAGQFRECEHTLMGLIRTHHETSDYFNLLAWCYYKQGKYQETVQAFDQAIDLEPTNESNYLDLGQTLIEHHLYEVASAVAQRAVERIPNSYRVYMLKGMVEAKQARYMEAIKSYAKAFELNAGSPEANFNLARVQFLAGLPKEAERTFERGIQKFPHDAFTYQEYALMLLRLSETGDAGLEAHAVSLFKGAIAENPSLSEPHYQLGNLWLRKGKASEAIRQLEIAAGLESTDPKIHYALARAYRHLGQDEKAARELELYEKLKSEQGKAASADFPAAAQK